MMRTWLMPKIERYVGGTIYIVKGKRLLPAFFGKGSEGLTQTGLFLSVIFRFVLLFFSEQFPMLTFEQRRYSALAAQINGARRKSSSGPPSLSAQSGDACAGHNQ